MTEASWTRRQVEVAVSAVLDRWGCAGEKKNVDAIAQQVGERLLLQKPAHGRLVSEAMTPAADPEPDVKERVKDAIELAWREGDRTKHVGQYPGPYDLSRDHFIMRVHYWLDQGVKLRDDNPGEFVEVQPGTFSGGVLGGEERFVLQSPGPTDWYPTPELRWAVADTGFDSSLQQRWVRQTWVRFTPVVEEEWRDVPEARK